MVTQAAPKACVSSVQRTAMLLETSRRLSAGTTARLRINNN